MNQRELPAYDLTHLRVLVVDGNKHMRTILRHILKALGVRDIQEASDGAEAFKVMRTFNPDMVLTELTMEPLDGIEFTKMLRTAQDSPNPFVPIIMVTGYTEAHNVNKARDCGIDEFLAKPVSAKTLYARMVAVIAHRRPFVRTSSYFGPDRHRRDDGAYKGPRRRSIDSDSPEYVDED